MCSCYCMVSIRCSILGFISRLCRVQAHCAGHAGAEGQSSSAPRLMLFDICEALRAA